MEENREEVKIVDRICEQIECHIDKLLETGINPNNLEQLYKLVDIHKDIKNEKYWEKKEECMMRYRYDYDENYGARRRDSRGRYMEGNYGRRGMPRSGRGHYPGEEMIEDMHESYKDYSDSKEEMNMGNYGAEGMTVESLEFMLKSAHKFLQMLEEEADTPEEKQIISKYKRKMSEM